MTRQLAGRNDRYLSRHLEIDKNDRVEHCRHPPMSLSFDNIQARYDIVHIAETFLLQI